MCVIYEAFKTSEKYKIFKPSEERMIPQHDFQKSTVVPIRTGIKYPGFDKYSFHIEMLLNVILDSIHCFYTFFF